MSKYGALWQYLQDSGKPQLTLTFTEVEKIAGMPLDHSFLRYKKELTAYGYEVQKISMKAQTVAGKAALLQQYFRLRLKPHFGP